MNTLLNGQAFRVVHLLLVFVRRAAGSVGGVSAQARLLFVRVVVLEVEMETQVELRDIVENRQHHHHHQQTQQKVHCKQIKRSRC